MPLHCFLEAFFFAHFAEAVANNYAALVTVICTRPAGPYILTPASLRPNFIPQKAGIALSLVLSTISAMEGQHAYQPRFSFAGGFPGNCWGRPQDSRT